MSGPSQFRAEQLGSRAEDGRERVRDVLGQFRGQLAEWEQEGHLPRSLFAALGAARVFRDRWGAGAAGGLPRALAMVEEAAPLSGGAALALSIHSEVFTHALYRFGGERHGAVLDAALRGEVIGSVAFTEPGGGSDLYAARTTATRATDGTWLLRGEKRFMTNIGRATHVMVFARTGAPRHAFSLFLVPTDRPGVQVTRFFRTFGMRAADTGAITLDVRLTPEDVIGRADAGLMYTLRVLDYERIAGAAAAVASGRAGLALATAHLRERQQFGRRLLDHQALAHRLADRWADLQAAAALVDSACRSARGDDLPHHLVAAAKLVAARASLAALDEGIQFLGARGYTEDYPMERMYRDARVARIGGGTDEVLREIVVRHLDVPDAEASRQLDLLGAEAELTSSRTIASIEN
jgi:alkylation response protein AidB-like acyl-CoA dehydrogenase